MYDIVVVGGGPAGYIAAIKAARLGKVVALVEKDTVGGTCLNRGCIPTKTYLKTAEIVESVKKAKKRGILFDSENFAVDMKAFVAEKNRVVKKLTGGVALLLKSNGIKVYNGIASVKPNKTVVVDEKTVLETKSVIYAGGSMVAKVNIQGIESKHVLTSDSILDITELPKSLLVIGGGVIGMEMADVFNALGCNVTIVELMDRCVANLDKDISKTLEDAMTKKGITIHTSTRLEKLEEKAEKLIAHTDKGEPIEVDKALLSIGRVPDLSGLKDIGVDIQKGKVAVDKSMKTNIDWIYAPGDVNGKLMLAHAAFKMGEVAAMNACGHRESVDLCAVPSCIYTHPQVGCVGLTEDDARERHDIHVGKFPFAANGKAIASGDETGFVKVISDKKYGEVLGVHIIGGDATEMIAEAASLMANEITVEEIARTIHAHPTYSEAFMEAAADSLDECLHLPLK